MAAETRVVSSLEEVTAALQELQINDVNQAVEDGPVRFRLHEKAPVEQASLMKLRVRPGRRGFWLLNPELLDCKCAAKSALEMHFRTLYDQCINQCIVELATVDASIAPLNALLSMPEEQIQLVGPDLITRNQGVQHVIYPSPLFPHYPVYEWQDDNHRVPYHLAFATQGERDAALVRDRHAQRAFWQAKVRLLEVKKFIIEKKKMELVDSLNKEYRKIIQESSDLGAGYANYA